MKTKTIVMAAIGTLAGVGVYSLSGSDAPISNGPVEFTDAQVKGAAVFDENCAVCHGEAGAGANQGPPLVHIIYESGHHSDATFQRAVALGVRQHHWRFGDMTAVEGVSQHEVALITDYIRALQRAAGIN